MNYGLPYMGSKSRICEWLMAHLPPAETFVDLFAGGCAVTHAALLSGRYQHFLANDIQGEYPRLFLRLATEGLKPEEFYPVSREEFEFRKAADPLIRLVWSFGNNEKKGYLYANELEPLKLVAHEMCVASSVMKRYTAYRKFIKMLVDASQEFDLRLFSIERLDRLKQLQSLGALDRLKQLCVLGGDYRNIKIPENSTVYADPPYAGTAKYSSGVFNHAEFYDWLRHVQHPVYVSEYAMPDDFVCVAETELKSILGSNNKSVIERLFLHERFAERHETMNLFKPEDFL